MEETLKSLKERCKRTVLRKIDTGEVTFDPVKKIFIYKDTEEEYKVGEKREGDNESDSDDDDDSENDSDKDDVKNNDDSESDEDPKEKETIKQ